MICNFMDCRAEVRKLYPLTDGETLREIHICEDCFKAFMGYEPNTKKGSLKELFGRN